MTNTTLTGKTYIITGASRGIGLATARVLGRRGARVALFGRDAGLLAKNASEIGNQSFPVVVDVAVQTLKPEDLGTGLRHQFSGSQPKQADIAHPTPRRVCKSRRETLNSCTGIIV